MLCGHGYYDLEDMCEWFLDVRSDVFDVSIRRIMAAKLEDTALITEAMEFKMKLKTGKEALIEGWGAEPEAEPLAAGHPRRRGPSVPRRRDETVESTSHTCSIFKLYMIFSSDSHHLGASV